MAIGIFITASVFTEIHNSSAVSNDTLYATNRKASLTRGFFLSGEYAPDDTRTLMVPAPKQDITTPSRYNHQNRNKEASGVAAK